jgi:hypothetical protein
MESLDSGHTTVKTENSQPVSVKARTLAHESYCGVLGWLHGPPGDGPPAGTQRVCDGAWTARSAVFISEVARVAGQDPDCGPDRT